MTIPDVLLEGNNNVFPICHPSQGIHYKNVHDLDLNLQIRLKSNGNVHVAVESPHVTFYLIAIRVIAMFDCLPYHSSFPIYLLSKRAIP